MAYTRYFLISELQRFYDENNRVPTAKDMGIKKGYPSSNTYQRIFGTWNNALIAAGFEINMKHQIGTLDGTETCYYCGCTKIEGQVWCYDKDENRFCEKHGQKPDYVLGNLDINSPKGLGRAGEILVVKTLEIGNEHDCNRISCHYSIDMYHKDYDRIDVKTALFSHKYNYWVFIFKKNERANTYICIGLSSDRKNVLHVWIVPNEGKIRNLQTFGVCDTCYSLSTHRKWEVDPKPYDNMWQTMKLNNCKIMVDKSKINDKSESKVTRTWEETLEALTELNKKYRVKSNI